MPDESIKERIADLLREAGEYEAPLCRLEYDDYMSPANRAGVKKSDLAMEHEIELRGPFSDQLQLLFEASVLLVSSYKNEAGLKLFHERFGKKFESYKAASDFEFDPDRMEQPRNRFLSELRDFLGHYMVIDESDEYSRRRIGIEFLERLLTGTATLLHQFNVHPKKESEVTHAASKVVKIMFPQAGKAPPRFFKSFRRYKPDILIPDVAAAVEYKYAVSEVDLTNQFGQIAEDVKGYEGDPDYKCFYAVFYLKHSFWTPERCQHAWEECKFPDEWKAFFVVGSG